MEDFTGFYTATFTATIVVSFVVTATVAAVASTGALAMMLIERLRAVAGPMVVPATAKSSW